MPVRYLLFLFCISSAQAQDLDSAGWSFPDRFKKSIAAIIKTFSGKEEKKPAPPPEQVAEKKPQKVSVFADVGDPKKPEAAYRGLPPVPVTEKPPKQVSVGVNVKF